MGRWRNVLFAWALVGAAFAEPAIAQDEGPSPEDGVPVGAASEASVGASVSESERMVVQVSIGGAGPYPFIVDTAAERSVISRELAQQLSLPTAGSARILSLTDSRDVGMVHARDVSFMPGERQDLIAFSLNGRHVGASGILGIDALRGQRVVLDFEGNQLLVGPSAHRRERFGPDEIVVRARRRFGQLVLVDSEAEGVPVDVVVDSGLAVSVGNQALRRLLVARRRDFQQVYLLSVTGEQFSADYTRVDNLRIGGFAINGLPVAFSDTYFFQRMRLTNRPALMLGMDALQMFRRVDVDFPNRRAVFVMPEGVARRMS